MQSCRKKEIRIKADSFREKCRVSRYGIINLFKDCELCDYKLLRYPLGEGADLGFTLKKDADIVIFTNTCSRLSREIFTLAHEIGHVLLHMESVDSFIDDANTISRRSTNEKEQEANYFAACLLMPAGDVKRFLERDIEDFNHNGLSAIDIARMMSEFNVSFDMVLNRLENLGSINVVELEHHGQDILSNVDADIASGKIEVYTDEIQTVNDFNVVNQASDLQWSFKSQITKFIKRFWNDPYKEADKQWMRKLVAEKNIKPACKKSLYRYNAKNNPLFTKVSSL